MNPNFIALVDIYALFKPVSNQIVFDAKDFGSLRATRLIKFRLRVLFPFSLCKRSLALGVKLHTLAIISDRN